jgi:signal transduction histidine kinase
MVNLPTMMSVGIRWRLTALGFAVALMGAIIVVITLTLQRMAVESRARLAQVDLESFRIADHFRDKLRFANDKMRRFASTEDPAAWEEFQTASHELQNWVGQQELSLETKREKQVLLQMRSGYTNYLKRAEDLRAQISSDNKTGASLAQFNGFLDGARHFMDLGQELSRAHYEYRTELVAHVSGTLTRLRYTLLGFVVLLFAFGLALALGVYRDLIGPLRVKLVKSEELAERNEKLASLGLLAAGVAHEIRNPLTAIKTGLFIQQKKFPTGSPEHQDGEAIEREILRLERIVNQFLQFARPAQPQLVLIPASQPLEEVEKLLVVSLAQETIQLVREESSPMRIKADPAQLKQVLINLVQNAADSIGRGGTITLRARPERRPGTQGEMDVVVLEVADTGKGITPEVEKRLFDPFFTTKDTGTGLGLSIAARVVEMNGGSLQYQTQVNRGSTFGIVLPRQYP